VRPTAVSLPPAKLVLLIGLPASGKSSFFRARFAGTHEHVSGDLLRHGGDSRRRQREHVEASLRRGASVVIDNTNATVEARARWLALGRSLGARLVGYYFEASVRDCLARNRQRPDPDRVPDVAIHVVAARFQTPTLEEGFDELSRVRLLPAGGFEEEPSTLARPGSRPARP
jgi:predicted kinase